MGQRCLFSVWDLAKDLVYRWPFVEPDLPTIVQSLASKTLEESE